MKEIFISYSHKDEQFKEELDTHLTSLKRMGLINVWNDRRIEPGKDFSREIDSHIETAEIILLLISPDFIASDYCYEIEMNRAIQRHKDGSTVILPVILRPCNWQQLPFGRYLAATKDGKPITKYTNYDDGYLEVVQSLKKLIGENDRKEISPSLDTSLVHPQIIETERSGNLSIKKDFSDEEKDKFELKGFEFVFRYFNNSLDELSKRQEVISYGCRRIDSNTFECIIYSSGKEVSSCVISLGRRQFVQSGISFSYGRDNRGTNETLTVENDGYLLYFKPTMSMYYSRKSGDKLSMEGAAEYLWSMFIERLQ